MVTTQEAKTKEDLALDLGRSIAELRIYLRQFIQVKIREHNIDITFEMLEVMSCLWKKDGVNQQEIADITFRDKSSMTYLLDNLLKRKLIKKAEDEVDRRNKMIYLTPHGIELKEQLQPWVAEVYELAAANLDVANLHAGLYVVNKMISNLKKT